MWTLRSPSPTRLHAVAVLGPLLVAVVALGAVYWANQNADNREAWVRHSDQVQYSIAALDGSVTDAAYGCRGWALLGDSSERSEYLTATAAIAARTTELRSLTADNPFHQRRLDTLGVALANELGRLAQIAQLATAGQRPAALDLLRRSDQDAYLADVHRLTDALTAEEARLREHRVAAERRQRIGTTMLLFSGVGLSVLLSAVMSGLFARAAVREAALSDSLRESNISLTNQTTELEAQAKTLEEQAGELEMANLSLEEQAVELEHSNEELATTTEELMERSAAAETANRAKSEFLTRMSHELRTPLNAITGYASLLSHGVRGAVSETQQEDLTRIQRAAQHLLGLINDVLNFARVEVGRVQFAIADVPAAAVMAEAAAMIEPLAEARGLAFAQDVVDGLVVRADHERAVQIVINLLTNAVKFTPAGGRVRLTAAGANARVEFAVIDTGRGIPRDALDQIFDPFVQIGRSTTEGDGLGLGLAISRELARAMGGDLRVVSEVGRGSVFTLELPAARM